MHAMALRKSSKLQQTIGMRYLNAHVLPRKVLNRNFFFGPSFLKVLERRASERKRKPNANASVSGTPHF